MKTLTAKPRPPNAKTISNTLQYDFREREREEEATGESNEIPTTPWAMRREIRVRRIWGRGARARRRQRRSRIVVVNGIRIPAADDSRSARVKQRWRGRHLSAVYIIFINK